MFAPLLTSLIQKMSNIKQRLVRIKLPSIGKGTLEGVFGSMTLKAYISTIFVLIGLFVAPTICAGETNEIEQDHKQFYLKGAVLDVSGVLGLSSLQRATVKEVAVSYNMVLSSLEADWLYNGEVIGHTAMPKGLMKSIHFTYDKSLTGDVSMRFTGAKGQVQVLRVRAVIGGDAISENNVTTVRMDKRRVSLTGQIKEDYDEKAVKKSFKGAAEQVKGVKSIETDFKVIKPRQMKILPFVPDVVGKSLRGAEDIIGRRGFRLKVEKITSFKEEFKGQEDRVVLQSPKIGTQLTEGSEVTVTVYSFKRFQPESVTNEGFTMTTMKPKTVTTDELTMTGVRYIFKVTTDELTMTGARE